MNSHEIEIYEANKILGDVFEAIVGAVFEDGGIEKVVEVYQHMLAPFVLFVAKFSKKLYKEPKEDFILLSNKLKIKPDMKSYEP
jgi:dsRNA-specific ribonuclease